MRDKNSECKAESPGSQIVFLEDKRTYDEFTSGNFEFGATAQAVAITAGAQAGTAGKSAGASAGPKTGVQAETKYHKGMAVFVHAKGGLMGEATVGGQKFTFEPLWRIFDKYPCDCTGGAGASASKTIK